MADALCGPSNALRSFQKHTQVDRTLQQDRLTGPRHSPAQGFRSFDPRTGSLDADFHAFENAASNPFQFGDPLLNQASHHVPSRFHQTPQSSVTSWASDFQNLSVADRPIPAQQFRMEAPLVRSAPGGWQNEFMRQRENTSSTSQQGAQFTAARQNGMMQENPFQSNMFAQTYNGYQQQQHYPDQTNAQPQLQNHTLEQMSASDWSQAFEEAFESAGMTADGKQHLEPDSHRDQILHQDGTYTNDRSLMHEQIHEPPIQNTEEQIRIGSDAIEYTEVQDRTADHETKDANALARVAGELLHNISHETDDKFQNSQFLTLMRKIRDREVEVRNNDFESTSSDTHMRNSETKGKAPETAQFFEARPKTPLQQDTEFSFPDMDQVYQPNPQDIQNEVDTELERPQSQIQDLHPGGRLYPGGGRRYGGTPIRIIGSDDNNSGGEERGQNISADDFEYIDENRSLGTRFGSP